MPQKSTISPRGSEELPSTETLLSLSLSEQSGYLPERLTGPHLLLMLLQSQHRGRVLCRLHFFLYYFPGFEEINQCDDVLKGSSMQGSLWYYGNKTLSLWDLSNWKRFLF